MFGKWRGWRQWLGRRPDLEKVQALLSLVNEQSQPNLNRLMVVARELEPMSLTVKQLGYELARRLAAAIPPPQRTAPSFVGLASKLSTQADIESAWVAHWCAELGIPIVYHRKLWELSYVLQAIFDNGCLRPGARGLGFGCGKEVIPSYLASHDVSVTATDLPPDDAGAAGWMSSNQHAGALEQTFHAHLVSREAFEARVGLRYIDMNAIPADLAGYDFCWSICALEHLGTIARGMEFVERTVDTLVPGGVSVHTTEFNVREDGPTIDNWPTVLFQRRHLEALSERLRARGHEVAAFDFDLGDKPMDRFIDVPPWDHQLPLDMRRWLGEPLHLKLSVDGFVCTCLGIIVRKGGG